MELLCRTTVNQKLYYPHPPGRDSLKPAGVNPPGLQLFPSCLPLHLKLAPKWQPWMLNLEQSLRASYSILRLLMLPYFHVDLQSLPLTST